MAVADITSSGGSEGPRAAAERIISDNSVTVRMGDLQFDLPCKEQLAYFVGLGILTALEVIDWPVALAIAVGHELARSNHSKSLREFGEALEQA
ncbi:hypothetical protein [Streptomyces sp. SID2888]|uniref:Uncharacterized protein n=2 Tax=Streptomyces nodosus TaxID=40318 RepID=A0A5P2VZK7_9ACTN|nr:hypothetical protein [Streptomyces sp. SID2888]MYV48923.1 hypothetical protein [Streptomyces sp. SID2888]QEV39064.1 hypothetical protein CP978_11265 [Streptomyces nodosus]